MLDHPILEGKYVMNDEEWDTLVKGLNRLGKIAKDKGMGHDLPPSHGQQWCRQRRRSTGFMESVDPDSVFLLFDSGHCSFAGIDPEKVLRKYVDRVRHVHLKDLRTSVVEQARKEKWSFLKGVRAGTFTVPGDGDVNFAPLFEHSGDAGYQGWVVVEAEQDPAKANPLEYAMKARKSLPSIQDCKKEKEERKEYGKESKNRTAGRGTYRKTAWNQCTELYSGSGDLRSGGSFHE